MGRLDEARAAYSRSGNTRLDMVIDVLNIIYDYFVEEWDRKFYENFYEYHTSSSPKVIRKSLTDYYEKALDNQTRSVYRRIRKGGYKVGNED